MRRKPRWFPSIGFVSNELAIIAAVLAIVTAVVLALSGIARWMIGIPLVFLFLASAFGAWFYTPNRWIKKARNGRENQPYDTRKDTSEENKSES